MCADLCLVPLRRKMGFDNVWNARKGPRAEGKVDTTGKGNPISGKGTRECRCDQPQEAGLRLVRQGWIRGGGEAAGSGEGSGHGIIEGSGNVQGSDARCSVMRRS